VQASQAVQYNNYASTSHASPTSPQDSFWPENQGDAAQHDFGAEFSNVDFNTTFNDWTFSPPTQPSPSPVLPRLGGHLTPKIQLTGPGGQAPEAEGIAAPLNVLPDIYDTGSPQAPFIPHLNQQPRSIQGNTSNLPTYISMGHHQHTSPQNMTPHTSNAHPIMSPVSMGESPVSDHYPRPPNIPPSKASSTGQRPDSPDERSPSPDVDATVSPRRGNAFKRAEDPPRNAANKMVCRHKDCIGQNPTFERKCEWRFVSTFIFSLLSDHS
jgi:hypothetical protein